MRCDLSLFPSFPLPSSLFPLPSSLFLTPTPPPTTQGVASKLERKMNQDMVGHLLESRPERSDIEAAGLHKGDRIAPRLQVSLLGVFFFF